MILKIFFEVKFLWKFNFLKIHVMGSTQSIIDLLNIVHVKVGFFVVLKMCNFQNLVTTTTQIFKKFPTTISKISYYH